MLRTFKRFSGGIGIGFGIFLLIIAGHDVDITTPPGPEIWHVLIGCFLVGMGVFLQHD